MLNRRAVQLLVAVFVPSLLALAVFGALGWTHAGVGTLSAAAIGGALTLNRKLRRRPWKVLLATGVLNIALGTICHLLARQTVVIENQSGQTVWLRLWARDQGNSEEVFELSGLRAGATFRFSFEGPFLCHGVAVSGVLRDHTPLTEDASADAFYQSRHQFTRIHISEHAVCRFSSE